MNIVGKWVVNDKAKSFHGLAVIVGAIGGLLLLMGNTVTIKRIGIGVAIMAFIWLCGKRD